MSERRKPQGNRAPQAGHRQGPANRSLRRRRRCCCSPRRAIFLVLLLAVLFVLLFVLLFLLLPLLLRAGRGLGHGLEGQLLLPELLQMHNMTTISHNKAANCVKLEDTFCLHRLLP